MKCAHEDISVDQKVTRIDREDKVVFSVETTITCFDCPVVKASVGLIPMPDGEATPRLEVPFSATDIPHTVDGILKADES